MIQWYEVLAIIGIVVLFELITLAIGYSAGKRSGRIAALLELIDKIEKEDSK